MKCCGLLTNRHCSYAYADIQTLYFISWHLFGPVPTPADSGNYRAEEVPGDKVESLNISISITAMPIN